MDTKGNYSVAGVRFQGLRYRNTVAQRSKAYREENHLGKNTLVPVDAVGRLREAARPGHHRRAREAPGPRVAAASGLPLQRVQSLIEANTDERAVGILGEPGVNVLALNLALDKLRS